MRGVLPAVDRAAERPERKDRFDEHQLADAAKTTVDGGR
jgi:hypothetical protein